MLFYFKAAKLCQMLIEREKLNSLLKGDIKLFIKKYENAYVKMKKEGEIFKIFQR